MNVHFIDTTRHKWPSALTVSSNWSLTVFFTSHRAGILHCPHPEGGNVPELFQPQNGIHRNRNNTMLVRGVFAHMLASVCLFLHQMSKMYYIKVHHNALWYFTYCALYSKYVICADLHMMHNRDSIISLLLPDIWWFDFQTPVWYTIPDNQSGRLFIFRSGSSQKKGLKGPYQWFLAH